ncbi:MAG: anhydro-N-acetylmuramic acid kinase [Candidatus Melainabacteria bacterium GWF2_37_15]|nr:MAG: anhydro-N-acetylmuramic acid kinase [Candidatus Melainabacteria bacterium GWF2_37_15]
MEPKHVVGLMSGTSADGIDACIVKIYPDFSFSFIDGIVYPYPENIKDTLFKIFQNQTSVEEICRMNFAIGECFAEAANELITKTGVKPDLIGSHGQTVWHEPGKNTLQIGEGAVIAERIGALTISDFRTADIAAGGQGAPLVSFADEIMFKKDNKARAIQNIGGIGNVTVVAPGIDSFAFDTGPGNVIIDYCAKKYFNQDYDKDGLLAAQGKVDEEWLNTLLSEHYYRKSPPKTTGRELFSVSYIETALLSAPESPYDIMATVTALTASTIFNAYRDFVFPVTQIDEVIIGGGGGFNSVLMEMLKNKGLNVLKHEDFGISDKFKEAIAFAMLAYATYYRIPNNVPSCTGARHTVVLGKVSYNP